MVDQAGAPAKGGQQGQLLGQRDARRVPGGRRERRAGGGARRIRGQFQKGQGLRQREGQPPREDSPGTGGLPPPDAARGALLPPQGARRHAQAGRQPEGQKGDAVQHILQMPGQGQHAEQQARPRRPGAAPALPRLLHRRQHPGEPRVDPQDAVQLQLRVQHPTAGKGQPGHEPGAATGAPGPQQHIHPGPGQPEMEQTIEQNRGGQWHAP